MEPTLYVELVDRTDPERPFTVQRTPVTVSIDDEEIFRTGDGWMIAGDDVEGGHQLGHGDVVLGVDRDDDLRMWLCEVVLVQGSGEDRYYELSRLQQPRPGEWARGNADPRLAPFRPPRPDDGQP